MPCSSLEKESGSASVHLSAPPRLHARDGSSPRTSYPAYRRNRPGNSTFGAARPVRGRTDLDPVHCSRTAGVASAPAHPPNLPRRLMLKETLSPEGTTSKTAEPQDPRPRVGPRTRARGRPRCWAPPAAAGHQAHAQQSQGRKLLAERPQRAQVSSRDRLLGLDLDGRMVSQNEVHLKARGRAPTGERLAGDIVPVSHQLVHETGPQRLTKFRSSRTHLAPLKCGDNPRIKEVELGGDERFAETLPLPGRKLGNLSVIGNFGKVDHGTIAERRDLKKATEGRSIARGALLQVGARVRLEIGRGVVRKVDQGQQTVRQSLLQVKARPQLPIDQRVQPLGASPPPEQIDAPAPKLACARAGKTADAPQ